MTSKKQNKPSSLDVRLARGRARDEARFTAAPPVAELPPNYFAAFAEIKQCVQQPRLRAPHNLKYMGSLAAAWPDFEIMQLVVAQLLWRQNIAHLDKLRDATTHLWYAQQGVRHGWTQRAMASSWSCMSYFCAFSMKATNQAGEKYV